MSLSSTIHAIVLGHCTYTAGGIREAFMHDIPWLAPRTTHLATATIVQSGQVLAGMIFRCDLPLTDPHISALVDRLIGTIPSLVTLLEDDPSRAVLVEPIHHRRDLPQFPDAATCREIFLHAFLKHAAAGAA